VLNLVGKTFNRFTIIKVIDEPSNGHKRCLCKCSCGTYKIVRYEALKSGSTQSCGCLRRENAVELGKGQYKHGLSATRVYRIWYGMVDRCNEPTNAEYHNYGGRGIIVCDEWLDFMNFYTWATNNGYSGKMSIERKDVNGNYEPSNCSWIPSSEQNFNKRNTHNITINGITQPMGKWAHLYGIKLQTMYKRLNAGWTGENLLKPVDKRFVNSGNLGRNLKKEG
jgi:hypothetical protein